MNPLAAKAAPKRKKNKERYFGGSMHEKRKDFHVEVGSHARESDAWQSNNERQRAVQFFYHRPMPY
jgi:hypothetical protein